MAVNANKVHRWKADIKRSVDFYNEWFLCFAPKAYRDTRARMTSQVELALAATQNLLDVSSEVLRSNPSALPTLRMCTAPPLAVDRLIGLTGVRVNLVKSMEDRKRIPPRMLKREVTAGLGAIARMIMRLADQDLFPWLKAKKKPMKADVYRAATVVADRLCGAIANPIIRNAQEKRQLAAIRRWLEARGYTFLEAGQGTTPEDMKPGTFSFHLNVPVELESGKRVKLPVDAAIKPLRGRKTKLPFLVEAKSAGDFTNTNKRRKEEATKVGQLQRTYGRRNVKYALFLCGYFDSGYLGYEAAEGIDWVWEHRIDDLAGFGL